MKLMDTISNRPWIISIGVALAVVLWMASGAAQEPAGETPQVAAEPQGKPQPKVRVRTQAAEEITRYVTLYGRTAPARVVELKSETSGKVVKLGAQRGERVRKGEMLVRLDERDRSARLEQARALVRQRELEYEARHQLQPEGYVSDSQMAEAVANLESARAELKRAELDLEYMLIRAPFDGALHERMVEVGDYLASGDPVATFVEDGLLIVTGSVSEQDVHAVTVGSVGEADLITGQTVQGRIRYVAPVAAESTRTFTVELEVDNSDGRIPAGVTAELRLPVGTIYAQKVAPSLLTLDDAGNLGVKTVDETGRVIFHPADIAQSSNEGVWLAGLPEEATIITVGQGFVKTGDLVDAVADPAGGSTGSMAVAAGMAQ